MFWLFNTLKNQYILCVDDVPMSVMDRFLSYFPHLVVKEKYGR